MYLIPLSYPFNTVYHYSWREGRIVIKNLIDKLQRVNSYEFDFKIHTIVRYSRGGVWWRI